MEAVAEIESEETIQFEDVQLSDSEEDQGDIESTALRIDYNSRLVSNEMHAHFFASDSCDTRFSKNKNYKSDLSSNDQAGTTTSDEEFEFSDEDQQSSEAVCLRKIDLDSIACASSNCDLNSTSSFDYSTTSFKEECLTDAEYISDEESDLKLNEKTNNASVYEKKNRKLSFGLSVAELASTVKDVFSSRQTTLSTMNITNPFFANIDLKKDGLSKISQNTKSSLMTCLEFLKADPSEDELTDIEEDFFTDSFEDNIYNSCDLEEAIRFRGKCNSQSSDKKKVRNCSWTMELFSDDETFQSENKNVHGENNHLPKRNTKQNVENADYNESLTDEEMFDFDRKEWTETDESGSIRQITQIKTETSIKLEGDGDDSVLDGEDLISRATTTTTTRIVTTVTTEDGEENDQQTDGGEDLRHSVEVILNQFMSDGDSSKQEESHSGPEE